MKKQRKNEVKKIKIRKKLEETGRKLEDISWMCCT